MQHLPMIETLFCDQRATKIHVNGSVIHFVYNLSSLVQIDQRFGDHKQPPNSGGSRIFERGGSGSGGLR